MAHQPDETVSLRTWIAVLGTILGAFMAVLDTQITNASLREITEGISSTSVEASWISTSYLIGEIITIPFDGLVIAGFRFTLVPAHQCRSFPRLLGTLRCKDFSEA